MRICGLFIDFISILEPGPVLIMLDAVFDIDLNNLIELPQEFDSGKLMYFLFGLIHCI